jgi:hypothetical protein
VSGNIQGPKSSRRDTCNAATQMIMLGTFRILPLPST